jgi:hypothetical protein
MVVPTAALGASTASSSEFVVETQDRIDDDGNIGSAEDTDGDNVYATIQTAVDEAPAGATIDVTQGTYNESVLIDKSDITLVGVPGNTGAGAGNSAPVMDSGGTLAGAFELTHKADNVAIRGFNIANYTNLGVFPTTGRTRAIESVVVADNTFSGIKYSIGFLSREDGAILTDITANNNRISGGTIGINIFARTGVSEIENTHITNNVITGTRLDGIQLTAFSDNATIQDVTIQDNYIDSGLKGIDITSRQSDTTIQRISVENNDLTNSGEGVFLSAPEGGTLNTIDVGHNNVTDNTNGTVVDAETTGQVSVNHNSFEGNSNYAVSNRGDDILDARNNWWGDATGPTVASNPGGTGDKVSTNVSYEPATTRVVDVKNASAPVAGHAEVDIAADAGNVAGYELTVEFNESVLEVVDVQGADLGESSENIDNGNGVVTFTRGESQGVDDPTLATIEFNVTAAGQSNVTVDDAESAIYDADGDAISSITSEQGVVEDSVAGDGDVNGDDSVNAGDVILLQRYIVGDDVSIDEQAADVDGDGDIDASDALQIQQDIVSG